MFLAHRSEWQALCRAEVDGAMAKNRETQIQSAYDILGALPLQEWEVKFPVIGVAFREIVRLAIPGVMFRKKPAAGPSLSATSGRSSPTAFMRRSF